VDFLLFAIPQIRQQNCIGTIRAKVAGLCNHPVFHGPAAPRANLYGAGKFRRRIRHNPGGRSCRPAEKFYGVTPLWAGIWRPVRSSGPRQPNADNPYTNFVFRPAAPTATSHTAALVQTSMVPFTEPPHWAGLTTAARCTKSPPAAISLQSNSFWRSACKCADGDAPVSGLVQGRGTEIFYGDNGTEERTYASRRLSIKINPHKGRSPPGSQLRIPYSGEGVEPTSLMQSSNGTF